MQIKKLANIYLILALILGALVPVMLKIAVQNINLYEYLMLTFLVGLPTSFLFLVARKKTKRLAASMMNYKEFAFIAFLGILNYGMLEYGLTYAEKFVSASLATVIYRAFPLFMLIFLPFMLRERISKYQVIALVLAFAGLYIAVTGGSLAVFSNLNLIMVGLIVAIGLASAFVTVAIKKYSFDMEIAMFIFNFAALAFFAALFFIVGAPFQPVNASALVSILYVGVIYNVFVGLMYYGAFRMIKTTFVTNIYFLSPFITFLFSAVILGETIYPYYIAIAVLVSAGLLIQKFDKRGGTYLSTQKDSGTYVFHDVTSAFVNTDAPLIYNAIKSGGRVLAVKIDGGGFDAAGKRAFGDYHGDVLVYTSENKKFISKEQEDFVREIMGAEGSETILMGAGNLESGENELSRILGGA
jgi:drug/metabolite transporter (DMT)-like permease